MKRVPWWGWVAGATVVAVAFGAGVLLVSGGDPERPGPGLPDFATETPSATRSVDPGPGPLEPTQTMPVRVYLSRGEYLGVASRSVPATASAAESAMAQLLLGPTAAEDGWGLATLIPAGTRLLELSVSQGTARVDLSSEFVTGGGTHDAMLRLAQVVHTLTQFPAIERVLLLVEGDVVDVYSGEGIILDGARTRADFESVLPPILVEGPTPGEQIASPIRVRGTGNTFEASFMVRVLDDTGATVVEIPAMATSGSGTRGTFDVSVTYPDSARPAASVVVFEYSAQDGSEVNVIEIPVTMQR
ncbi:MAG: Gmad2 immunoglobulin-like domain-containing protein [Coriobacteriia bacterium]